MATFSTINDLYARYTDLFGREKPVWSRDELRDWKTRLGKRQQSPPPTTAAGTSTTVPCAVRCAHHTRCPRHHQQHEFKLTVRIPEDLHADLHAMRKEHLRTLQAQMVWCMRQCAEQWKREKRRDTWEA